MVEAARSGKREVCHVRPRARGACARGSAAATLSRVKATLGWIVVAVTALFVVFNLESASVWFFGIRVQMPLGLVVIGASLCGALATYAFTSLKRRA